MNDQSQPYEVGAAVAPSSEHIIFLREFDQAWVVTEKNMYGQDGEADFRIAADRARGWVERKNRHEAVRVLKAAHTARNRSMASIVLVA
jgi:hypothetical protein